MVGVRVRILVRVRVRVLIRILIRLHIRKNKFYPALWRMGIPRHSIKYRSIPYLTEAPPTPDDKAKLSYYRTATEWMDKTLTGQLNSLLPARRSRRSYCNASRNLIHALARWFCLSVLMKWIKKVYEMFHGCIFLTP